MKRIGNLFEMTFSEENLYAAYLNARKGKRGKRACFEFEVNIGGNIKALHDELFAEVYTPRPYHKFTVREPKPRLIRAPAFRDTVVQHAIYRAIYPIFNRCFISASFACRKGLGTHKASDYAQQALRQFDGELYTLKLDIRKFFYSIDRDILQRLIERKIKDGRFVGTMMMFAEMDAPVGIPIGNLLSQIYALIYLDPLDHFIKRDLKIRRYVRYVDDFILFGLTRRQCIECKEKILKFLDEKLRLGFSKSIIQKVRKGVNFVGYRTWRGRRFIRKYSLHKFNRKVKRQKLQSVVSLLGHARRTQSLRYMLGIIRSAAPQMLNQLPKYYRKEALHA